MPRRRPASTGADRRSHRRGGSARATTARQWTARVRAHAPRTVCPRPSANIGSAHARAAPVASELGGSVARREAQRRNYLLRGWCTGWTCSELSEPALLVPWRYLFVQGMGDGFERSARKRRLRGISSDRVHGDMLSLPRVIPQKTKQHKLQLFVARTVLVSLHKTLLQVLLQVFFIQYQD